MRRVKLLHRPQKRGRPLSLGEWMQENGEGSRAAEMLYFRHRCDDDWYEELIAAKGLRGKKITPSRLRRLIVEALERHREEEG